MRAAIGSSEDIGRFLRSVLQATRIPFQADETSIRVNLSNEVPRSLRQAIGLDEPFNGRFEFPLREGELYLGRTSPIVEGVSAWTLDQALDPLAREFRSVASRCGVISTSAVATRTTLLVARFRHHLRVSGASAEAILCEEILPLACRGPVDAPEWLAPDEAEELLASHPERNLVATAIDQQIGLLLAALPKIQVSLKSVAEQRAEAQLSAHERVREVLRTKGRVTVVPVLPVDVLAAYVLLPKPG